MRDYHPSYKKDGGVPAIEEVKFSITHNRGCFGGCNFCALAFHQGRTVRSRSIESVVREAEIIARLPDFKGYIHDVGGPTANFRYPSCDKQLKDGVCAGRKCLAPTPCKNLKVDHKEYIKLLEAVEAVPGVKRVFVRSGIRFDYVMYDKDDSFFRKLVRDNISGQLKVAPEHCSDEVLGKMGKPNYSVYSAFRKKFFELTKEIGKEQYLIPYLMSSHPGSTMSCALDLACQLKNFQPVGHRCKRSKQLGIQQFSRPFPGKFKTDLQLVKAIQHRKFFSGKALCIVTDQLQFAPIGTDRRNHNIGFAENGFA
jgi:uncharacterized radical SAM protein YgiQ